MKRWLDPVGWFTPRHRLLLEALLFLTVARLALACFSFARIARFLGRPLKKIAPVGGDQTGLSRAVSSAVDRAAAWLPGETVCFPRGLAAQAMLRRRGVNSTLYYGAATLPERGLTAHVWVQNGEEGVIGHKEKHLYCVLAQYPSTCLQ